MEEKQIITLLELDEKIFEFKKRFNTKGVIIVGKEEYEELTNILKGFCRLEIVNNILNYRCYDVIIDKNICGYYIKQVVN